MVYKCHRCYYLTNNKKDMKKHLLRKNKCKRILDSYIYNDKDIEELSLTKLNLENKEIIINDEQDESKEDLQINEKTKYINEIKKNNIKECKYCNKVFFRKYELIRHLDKSNCFEINNSNNNNKESNNIKNINNISNIKNEINNSQINNISINLFAESKYNNDFIVPFNKEWDLSNIDQKKKLLLFLSDNKYSKTMEEILKNDKNKNILFNDNKTSGVIYQDDKFVDMDSEEIIIKTMYKLYNHLINFYDEIKKDNDFDSDLNKHKSKLEEKYQDFNINKDNITKEVVKNILIDIFQHHKDKIIEQFIEFNKYISKSDNDNDKLNF